MRRYTVNATYTHHGGHWYIYDRTLWGECGLPVSEDRPSLTHPLRWSFSGDIHGPDAHMAWSKAHRWLSQCFTTWGGIPGANSPHPADVDWKAVKRDLSRAAQAQSAREAAVHEHVR